MSYVFMPMVVSTNPANMSVDVPVSTDITIVFSTDMDPQSLVGNIIVQKASGGEKVAGTITYADRKAVFKPNAPLEGATTYNVIVVGDADLEDGRQDGVKSILGYPMAGMYVFSFTTTAAALLEVPRLLSPANMTAVTGTVQFSWASVSGAALYEVQLAAVPEMDPLLWSTTTVETSVVPAVTLDDGNYFWRVRALDASGNTGLWSAVYVFSVGQQYVTEEEETSSPPNNEPHLLFESELTAVEPTANEIAVFLPLYLTESDILGIRLIGKSVTGMPGDDHGIVKVDYVIEQTDGGCIVRIRAKEEGGS